MTTSITFLAAVNATLKRVDLIQGASGELTSFTDGARQTDVDVMIQVWNDVVAELLKPLDDFEGEVDTGTITLATDDNSYSLASDFVRMVGNPIDSTNNRILLPYPGGWRSLRSDRLDRSDWTGVPHYWVINPDSAELEIDTFPTSDENGDVFTYAYEKDLTLAAITDSFPFNDQVVQALYAAVAQAWRKERNAQFDRDIYQQSLARATQKLSNTPTRTHWSPQRAAAR